WRRSCVMLDSTPKLFLWGYGGWGTDQALVALKRSGLSYEPDIVISQLSTNDLLENLALSGIEVQKPFRFQVVNGKLTMRMVQPRPGPWLKNFLLRTSNSLSKNGH